MKKFVLALVLSILVTGCGKENDETIIGFSVSTLDNPFFNTMVDEAKATAEELGAKLVVVDAQDDSAKQQTDIDDLVIKGADVVIINPVDSDAIVTSVETLNEKEIPVVTVDRASNGGEMVSHIASDNVLGGSLAGEYAIELLGGKGNVVILEGVPGASATIERGKGFEDAVKGKLEVIDKQTANFNRAEALTVMEDIISAKGKDINLVFAHNDEMALGASEALRAAGMSDVAVIGFDATDDALTAIKNGEMAATVQQQPDLMGRTSVEIAFKVTKGEKVEKNIPVEVKLIKE